MKTKIETTVERRFYLAISGSGEWKGIFRTGMPHTCPEAVVHFYTTAGVYLGSECNGHSFTAI